MEKFGGFRKTPYLCTRIRRNVSAKLLKDRDLAQLVAHTSGGREVAGSSPVIPTKIKRLRIIILGLFLCFSCQKKNERLECE